MAYSVEYDLKFTNTCHSISYKCIGKESLGKILKVKEEKDSNR